MPKFTVVTACRNAVRYIDETVESVLQQSVFRTGKCELEYLVYDGASTDGTLERLRPYESRGVTLVSEPDDGLYAALAKGLQKATGDYVAYLNAGDSYHPAGLDVAAKCFELPRVDWITGYAAVLNERSQITQVWLPYRYRARLFACGAYGTLLPFLQQESTAWRRTLHASVDFGVLRTLRVAGDSYLWKCFASTAQLRVVRGLIGAFRVHRGQISESMDQYLSELKSFTLGPTLLDRLRCFADRAVWAMPERVKLAANRASLIRYNHAEQAWTLGTRGA